MVLQDRRLDFDDFSSNAEKLSALLKRCEVSAQKHKLAHEYYRTRKFALLYPAVLACSAIGDLGLLVTTAAIKRHMKVGTVAVEDLLTLVVGFLGFYVGTTLLLMNQWDFGAQEGMHLGALTELEGLADRVRFWQMDRRVARDEGEHHTSQRGVESERKALGVVAAPRSHKVAMVVASGKKLQQVESEIQQKTVQAKKTEEQRSDVSR